LPQVQFYNKRLVYSYNTCPLHPGAKDIVVP